jgi:hypothetical protein
LLLVSVTVDELIAAALRFTEHDIDCAPVSDCVPHEIVLNAKALALELYVTPPHPARIETTQPASKAKVDWPMRLFVERDENRKETVDCEELRLT